jgi:toxin-antitoxin system PIN domain toxin
MGGSLLPRWSKKLWRTNKLRYLADVNVLIALTDENHVHHAAAMRWLYDSGHRDWGVCALTGAGFLRLSTSPKLRAASILEASEVLGALVDHPGYRFWPIEDDWATLAAPFIERVFGHQQITDAYLLGLAVKEDGILVTMDKAIQFLAGPKYRKNVLLLEPS